MGAIEPLLIFTIKYAILAILPDEGVFKVE